MTSPSIWNARVPKGKSTRMSLGIGMPHRSQRSTANQQRPDGSRRKQLRFKRTQQQEQARRQQARSQQKQVICRNAQWRTGRAGWRDVTRQRRLPQYWNEPRWSQKGTRMNQPRCRAGDIRKQKGKDLTAGKWNGRGKASQERASWYDDGTTCASWRV